MFSAKPFTVKGVDLNADLGEGDRDTSPGVDLELLKVISSASIACGGHAGDPVTMRRTVRLAREHAVAIGAHPSFLDRERFGRREMVLSVDEVEACVLYQVGALAAIAAGEGMKLQHVKPHGALYNMAAREPALARAIARAVRSIDPGLILFGLAGSALLDAGRSAGLRTASEVFADRAYRSDGSLVPRTEPGAVLHDPETVASRAVSLVTGKAGPVDTICVHGDTPGAVALARRIRSALEAAGIQVRPIGTPP